MSWICKNCQETSDDDQDICWQCGAGYDGSPPAADWRSELAPSLTASGKEIDCLRCNLPMVHAGRKQFHEGSYFADIVLGDFFIKRQNFDLYACGKCGKVEFFVTGRAS